MYSRPPRPERLGVPKEVFLTMQVFWSEKVGVGQRAWDGGGEGEICPEFVYSRHFLRDRGHLEYGRRELAVGWRKGMTSQNSHGSLPDSIMVGIRVQLVSVSLFSSANSTARNVSDYQRRQSKPGSRKNSPRFAITWLWTMISWPGFVYSRTHNSDSQMRKNRRETRTTLRKLSIRLLNSFNSILNSTPYGIIVVWSYFTAFFQTGECRSCAADTVHSIWWSSSPVEINEQLSDELSMTTVALKAHPKVYWIWNHRRWCLENVPNGPGNEGDSDYLGWKQDYWKKEMFVVEKMLDVDARNCESCNTF